MSHLMDTSSLNYYNKYTIIIFLRSTISKKKFDGEIFNF